MIIIIGAGISGLSVAFHLHKLGVPYRLLEADSRPGGYIRSLKQGPYLMEAGPNTLLADEAVNEIIAGAGLSERRLIPENVSKKRYIYRNGRYQKLPAGPAFLFSGFFSWKSKIAVFKERKNRTTGREDETVGEFFERRFSKEIVDYAVNPFVAGIYAGDPYQLLIDKTFPSLAEYESDHGSVVRGFLKSGKGTGRKLSYSFPDGMEEIPQAMVKGLSVDFSTKVSSIERAAGKKFAVQTDRESVEAENVVIATSSMAAASILGKGFPQQSRALNSVYYAPMCVVHSAFKRDAVAHPLNGFGGLHPKSEGLFTAGSIWSSSLFPNRCPKDEVLLTSFVGGSQYVPNTRRTDEGIKEAVTKELQQVYGIAGQPVYQNLVRWEHSIPQYDLNIKEAYAAAEALAGHGIHVCANWVGGVSVADCLKKGQALAEKLAKGQL